MVVCTLVCNFVRDAFVLDPAFQPNDAGRGSCKKNEKIINTSSTNKIKKKIDRITATEKSQVQ